MKKVYKSLFILTVLVALMSLFFFNRRKNKLLDQKDARLSFSYTQEDIAKGEWLAKKYCQSCHLFPDPDQLSRSKWQNLLPQMGIRLGITSYHGQSYRESIKSDQLIIPEKPLLTEGEWQKIVGYYENRSPLFLPPAVNRVKAERNLLFFTVHTPGDQFVDKQILASYVKIDSTEKPVRIWVANARKNQLLLFNHELKLIDSICTPGPVVDMVLSKKEILICVIGKDLAANDEKEGRVFQLHVSVSGKLSISPNPLFDLLARPVQIMSADLNGDHKIDYLICEFGNLTGSLLWMENQGNGHYLHHVISRLPGAIHAVLQFQDKGGLPDLWVLFTQGDEKIVRLFNKGHGVFEEKTILRFPAIYGSSFFELVDMDHDGYLDILYTCGDNGNATNVLKPYHGVYIFINDGHDQYHQEYFYPVNGCYKALARDFDHDGKIDIAAIGLYTDPRRSDEGFQFLKGIGGMKFKPYALSSDILFERAVTMDEGDIQNDGKKDLIIGNSFFDFGPFGKNIHEPLFFVLKPK